LRVTEGRGDPLPPRARGDALLRPEESRRPRGEALCRPRRRGLRERPPPRLPAPRRGDRDREDDAPERRLPPPRDDPLRRRGGERERDGEGVPERPRGDRRVSAGTEFVMPSSLSVPSGPGGGDPSPPRPLSLEAAREAARSRSMRVFSRRRRLASSATPPIPVKMLWILGVQYIVSWSKGGVRAQCERVSWRRLITPLVLIRE